MANEPQYRDLSKANPFLAPFNDAIVVMIDRVSLASAALVGLFGILYFSLAPAAMLTTVEVSSAKLSGYECKMISAVSKTINPYSGFFGDGTGIISIQSQREFVTKLMEVGSSIPIDNQNGDRVTADQGMLSSLSPSELTTHMNNFLYGQNLLYDSAQFDTYDNCVAAAQITCTWTSSKRTNLDYASSNFVCSVLKEKMQLKSNTAGRQMSIGYTLSQLSNQTRGKCDQQANYTTGLNLHEHCESLKSFMANFQDLLGKLLLTPEVICKPFFNNPPYICTKAVPPSVPSILSQSLAFTTSALAAVKAIMFFSFKVLRKKPVADNSGIEPEHSAANVAKYDKPETIP